MAASIRLEDLVAINRQMRAVDLTVKMLSSVPYGLLPDYYKQLGKEADVVVPGSPALAAPVEISEPAHCTPAPTGRWLEDKIDDVRDRLAAIEVLTRRVIKLEADHEGAELAIGRLHPQFVVRLANAIREARSAGLSFAGVFSAYRPPAFGIGAFSDKFNSLHSYGLAADVHGIGRPGSPEAQLWHEIAAATR
jgi:hypothetical protein